ncbi:MAG TPA: class I SAM-dependent methyltransferase [Actinomycetota bacterium]|nr:class I SAM-dependent methyltransferase [Actinomycetota bacterium]
MDSVSFDRAAEFYDRTRALDPQTMEAILTLVAPELRGRGRCLEIGIGTGRIALPLHEAGVPTAGVDLSRPMLDKLVAKAGGRMPFPVAVGDATVLPFADASFGAGLGCHILHLIPRWEAAVDELLRVVRPGGILLLDIGGLNWEPDEVETRFSQEAGLDRPRYVGLESPQALDDKLAAAGAKARRLPPIPRRSSRPVRERLESIEQNLYSWTWGMPDEVRLRAVDAVRTWALERFGSLEVPLTRETTIVWRAYDLPGVSPGRTYQP